MHDTLQVSVRGELLHTVARTYVAKHIQPSSPVLLLLTSVQCPTLFFPVSH